MSLFSVLQFLRVLIPIVMIGGATLFSYAGVAGEKPNILVILADDMGWSDAGCYGSEIRTPAIDSLAREGMLSTRCYTIPRCSPSRAALMTGRYPQSVGMGHLDNDLELPGYRGRLDPSCRTLPEILGEKAGYRTYMSGKWHLGSKIGERPWERGFQRYFGLLSGANSYVTLDKGRLMAEDGKILEAADLPEDFYMTEAITRKALSYLDDAAKHPDMPFFMYVAYTAPHTPLQASRRTIDSYKGTYSEGFEAVRLKRFKKQKSLHIIPADTQIPENRKLPETTTREEDMRMAIYVAQITDMDEGIGQILDRLKKYGMEDKTIVLFLSDNGATNENPARVYSPYPGEKWTRAGYGKNWAVVSNTPYFGFKSGTYEGGESIPCLVKYPGKIPAGKRFDGMMHMIDIAPTLLECAGVPALAEMNGINLLPYWQENRVGSPSPWKNSVAASLPERILCTEHEKKRSVHSLYWKLHKNVRERQWSLFASDDRCELKNVASVHKDVVADLAKRYENWARSNNVDESMRTYWPLLKGKQEEKKK